MKKNLKKGFTLVELVIVIAVIAILSAVLIPTFGNVINNAKRSSAQSEASNAMTQYTVNYASQGVTVPDGYVVVLEKKETFAIFNGTDGNEWTLDSTTASPFAIGDSGAKVGYVFDYTVDGGLGEKELKYSDTIKSENVKVTSLTIAVGGDSAAVRFTAPTTIAAGDAAISTYDVYLLDGALTKSDDGKTYTLSGKVILFAKK